jgi:hypothetical protein
MFNINFDLEMFDVVFEIYIEDKIVQRQRMQAPKEILMANFIQTANQIKPDKRPMKIRMSRQDNIWDNFEKKEKILDLDVECMNEAMEIWLEGR